MDGQIVKFEKPRGELARIHEEYLRERNIVNRYSKKELGKWGKIDLYVLLDLDMYRNKPIPPEILSYVVKAKRREYHPDAENGSKEAFLLVKIADDVFRDRKFRLFYDSGFLDERIPEDRIYYSDEFFREFGECFERNGKFSVKQPVPALDPRSSEEEVREFYEFWSNFKSWRSFEPVEELYTMNEYERAQYSHKNREELNRLKNMDVLRIKRLVQIAKKRDPRIGKSIESQVSEMMAQRWSESEESTLRRLVGLFGKARKNKWEIITSKLVEMTKVRRSVSEVARRGSEMEQRRR